MKNTDLDAILAKARLPEIPQESLDMFPRRIVAGLKRKEPGSPATRHFLPRLAWAFGLVTCVLIAYVVGHSGGQRETTAIPTKHNLASAKLIQEMMAMFPNQIRAIVQDDSGGLRLVLSDTPDVPASPPLYVRICDSQHCSSFVTFSGQEIQVNGQSISVLSDTRGGIILTGAQFVWSSAGRPSAASRLKVEARNLGLAAM